MKYLGDELVFRGGTCLHKLYLHPARRYSEDLDCGRRTAGGIGKVTRAISDIGANLGYEVRTKMSAQPKVYLRYTAESGTTRKIKVEVNPHERSPATSTVRLPYTVTSNWWSGQADVHTFSPAELVETKIRALYQRRKGRDLYDMWLALTDPSLALTGQNLLSAFDPYRPDGLTARGRDQHPARSPQARRLPHRHEQPHPRRPSRLRHRRGRAADHQQRAQPPLKPIQRVSRTG